LIFKKYLVFYLPSDSGGEILRVIYGGRDIEAILDEDLGENDLE
jgi:toxin ParE1/3/4